MNEGVMKFIMLVGAHFPRQKFSGEEQREALWLRSMGEILGEYDEDVLMEAATKIIRTRDPQNDGTMFPKPVECIRACDTVLRKRASVAFMASAAVNNTPVPGKEFPQLALPSIEIKTGDCEWDKWMDFLRTANRFDLVGEAESKGMIRTSSRWPRDDSVIFDPKPDGNPGFLNSLLSYKPIPN